MRSRENRIGAKPLTRSEVKDQRAQIYSMDFATISESMGDESVQRNERAVKKSQRHGHGPTDEAPVSPVSPALVVLPYLQGVQFPRASESCSFS